MIQRNSHNHASRVRNVRSKWPITGNILDSQSHLFRWLFAFHSASPFQQITENQWTRSFSPYRSLTAIDILATAFWLVVVYLRSTSAPSRPMMFTWFMLVSPFDGWPTSSEIGYRFRVEMRNRLDILAIFQIWCMYYWARIREIENPTTQYVVGANAVSLC